MTTFEKLSQSYSGIDLQSLSEKSHEELLTILLQIIQTGILENDNPKSYGCVFEITTDELADILRGREV